MILGGAQENTLYTVEGLDRREGWETLLVTGPAIGPEGELINRAAESGVRIEIVDLLRREISPFKDAAAYYSLKRIIRREKPEIVHTHSSKAGILGRAAATACGVPVIVHTIHGLPFHPYQNRLVSALYISLERWAARRCDAIITVCDAMAEKAVAAGVASREKFHTIYSGMELETFLDAGKERASVRRELGIPGGVPVVGKVARLFHLKGHKYLIEAMPRVLKQFPDTRFLFVGDGILREALSDRARELGVFDSIVFAGLVDPSRVGAMIGAMDLLVHCSLREGLARVLPQALLAGVPVISYDIDGAREVVQEGVTGRLLGPGAVDELAQAITWSLRAPEDAAAMAARGKELCVEMFGADRMVESIASLYEKLLKAS